MVSETDLLTALFAASSGTSEQPGAHMADHDGAGWPRFLQRLAAQTDAETAALLLEPATGPERHWQHGPDVPVVPERDRMRSGRVYSQDDLPGLYRRGLFLRALRTADGPWGRATLVLHRRHTEFRAMDGVQLSALLPYLGPALATWQTLARARRQAALERDMLQGLGAGWLVFSPGGLVLEMSQGAEALLAGAGLRIAPDGRPELRDGLLRRTLGALQPGDAPRLLTLSGQPRLDMVLSCEGQGASRRLVGRLRLERMARGLCPDRLAQDLGLSRSEARLAQRICDGLTLKAAAADLGWTLETARSASKRIYARMGLEGQTALVRRMQGSAVWLAPQGPQTPEAPGDGYAVHDKKS